MVKHNLTCLLLVAVLVWPSDSATPAPPELLVTKSDGIDPSKFHLNYSAIKDMGGKNRNGYLGVFDHAPSKFRIAYPALPDGKKKDNCTVGVAKTSVTAKANNCQYAVNGGPFDMKDGIGCIGGLVSNGKIVGTKFSSGYTTFGSTANGEWVIGKVGDAKTVRSNNIVELVTGFNWLVYSGENVVAAKGGEQAPRTALGVDKTGRLIVLEVDGCEKCKDPATRGPTMYDIAEHLKAVGAIHGINLDGGGSSTTVVNGTVVDFPTAFDINFKFQRNVATVICVGEHEAKE